METHHDPHFPLLAMAAIVGVVSLGACNTMQGVGEDVEAADSAVQDAAEEGADNEDGKP
jgi:predicted small secreted protein